MGRTRIALVLLLAAGLLVMSGAIAQVENRGLQWSGGEAHADLDLTSPASFCDDPEDSHSTGANGQCAIMINLSALTGGSSPQVALKVQTSSDRASWYDAITFTPCIAPCLVSDFGQTQLMRYYRMCYATTGSPATATATYWEECAP